MATRWRWPPDSSAGKRCMTDDGSDTLSSRSRIFASRSFLVPMSWVRSGSSIDW